MKQTTKVVYWVPRILCILAILFLSLFSLDAFEEGASFGQQLLAFLIHMIPSFALVAILILAWKYELIGGIIFVVIGLVFSPILFRLNYDTNDSIWMSLGIIASLTFPFIIVGVLFIISHRLRKKEKFLAKQ